MAVEAAFFQRVVTQNAELQQVQDQVQQSLTSLAGASSSPLGTPRIVNGTTAAKWGELLVIDETTGALTISLPSVQSSDLGRMFAIFVSTNGSNVVTVKGESNATVNGSASWATDTQGLHIFVACTRTQWGAL